MKILARSFAAVRDTIPCDSVEDARAEAVGGAW